MRQLLAESVVLATLGGALAVPLAAVTADLLPGFLPQGHISFALDIRPDARMLLFTGAIALIAGLVVGVVPAMQATHGAVLGRR